MRIGESSDVDDIKVLLDHCDLRSVEEVVRIVEFYYPSHIIPQKTFYALQELFDENSVVSFSPEN